jgi:hypothetical protein
MQVFEKAGDDYQAFERVLKGSREAATKSSTPNDRCTLPYPANIGPVRMARELL